MPYWKQKIESEYQFITEEIIINLPAAPCLLQTRLMIFSNSTWLLVGSWCFMQTTPSMFSKFSMHAFRWCGGRSKEHYITSLRVKLILACQKLLKQVSLNEQKKVALYSDSNTTSEHTPQVWRIADIVCKENISIDNHRGPGFNFHQICCIDYIVPN